MKSLYIILLFLLGFLTGCETEKPDLFVDTHFIKFLFNNPGEKEYYRVDYNFSYELATIEEKVISIPVEMNGYNLADILYFSVMVDEEKTTLPANCYDLKTEQPFRAGVGNVDSMRVTLIRKPILEEKVLLLRLKLVPNRDFQLYMPDSTFVEIYVEDIFSRPAWWDSAVEKAYLGKFSEKKYEEFVKETGITDFGVLDASEKRHYSIMFKRALEKVPRTDEDGGLMTVTIVG